MTNTPKIRFKGFTDQWEERKFSDIAIRESSVQNSTPNFPSVEYEDIVAEEGVLNKDISQKEIEKKGIKFDGSQILYGKLRPYLHNWLNPNFNGVAVGDWWVLKPVKADKNFLYRLIQIQKFDHLANQSSGSKMPRADWNLIANSFFFTPYLIPEQQRIGSFFQALDSLITQHQRKLEKLKNIKKACLEKMFPQKGATTPAIRFKGFTDQWVEKKLGEVMVNLQNNTLSRANLASEEGLAKNVHYGDILIKFGEVLDISKEELPMINDENIVIKYKTSYLQNGDIIIADTAEDASVGKCCEITGLNNEVVLSGLHTIPCRPTIKFSIGYLGYYLNSGAYHTKLIPLMQGIKVTSISKSSIRETNLIYPKALVEQQRIGTFFQALDSLITLHQRKLEKLKNIKKACLEKMFV